MQKSFWWWQCSDRYIISLFPPPPYPISLFSPSLISLMVFVDVKHHVYLLSKRSNKLNCKHRFTTSFLQIWREGAGKLASKETWCLTSTDTVRLIRDGVKGEGVMEVGGRGRLYIYLSLRCHHQNDSCIKMSSDASHFNVSLIVRNKATTQCPETTVFWRERRKESRSGFEPRSLCLPA